MSTVTPLNFENSLKKPLNFIINYIVQLFFYMIENIIHGTLTYLLLNYYFDSSKILLKSINKGSIIIIYSRIFLLLLLLLFSF